MIEPSNIIPISSVISPQQRETRADDDAPPVLETLANEIAAATERANGASKASLIHYRTIGEKLNAAKIAAGHGNFGAWAEEKGFKREWRRRLMSLAEHWHVLDPYLEGDGGEDVGYSVKEACGIIDRHLGRGAESKTDKQGAAGKQQAPARKKSENPPAERASGNRSASGGDPDADADVRESPEPEMHKTEPTEVPLAEKYARLVAELKEAHGQIENLLRKNSELEAEIADLKEANTTPVDFLMAKGATTGHLPA
jgi:hypothetical protein